MHNQWYFNENWKINENSMEFYNIIPEHVIAISLPRLFFAPQTVLT